MTEEGFLKAKEHCERYFSKEMKPIPLPEFTADARNRWNEIPEGRRKEILNSVWCTSCRAGMPMQLHQGVMSGRRLLLRGKCKKCGGEIARVIEPVEE